MAKTLFGKKVGETIKADGIGFAGYEFLLTGGSDDCGFPMRRDVAGFARKKLLFVQGVGLHKTEEGIRHRKTVCGQMISPKTTQLNVKVVKEGKESLEPAPKAEEAKPAVPAAK
jgi:small subunit ribosomal protein S6e